jgi:hypothetical protein
MMMLFTKMAPPTTATAAAPKAAEQDPYRYARYLARVSRRLNEERADEAQWPSPRIGYEPPKTVLILDARL